MLFVCCCNCHDHIVQQQLNSWSMPLPNYVRAEKEHIEAFKVFDRTGNRVITVAELRHLLTTLGDQLIDEDILSPGLSLSYGSNIQ